MEKDYKVVEGTRQQIDDNRARAMLEFNDGRRVYRNIKWSDSDSKYVQDGDDIPVRGVWDESGRRLVGHTPAGASAALGGIKGMLARTGVSGANKIVEHGAEKLNEIGWQPPDSPFFAPLATIAGGAIGIADGVDLAGAKAGWWDRGLGLQNEYDEYAHLSPDQTRAAAMVAGKDSTPEERARMARVIKEQQIGYKPAINHRPAGTQETNLSRWDEEDGNYFNPARYLGMFEGTEAMQNLGMKAVGGEGMVPNASKNDNAILATAEALPYMFSGAGGFARSKLLPHASRAAAVAGRAAGSASTTFAGAHFGPGLYDQAVKWTGGTPEQRDSQEQLEAARLGAVVSGATMPAIIMGILRATGKGGVGVLNKVTKRMRDDEAASAFKDYTDKDVVEAYQWLKKNGKKMGIDTSPLSNVEMLGDTGREALATFLKSYPQLATRIREGIGHHPDMAARALSRQGTNKEDAALAMKRAASGVKEMNPGYYEHVGRKVRDTARNLFADKKKTLGAKYNKLGSSPAMNKRIFRGKPGSRALEQRVEAMKKDLYSPFQIAEITGNPRLLSLTKGLLDGINANTRPHKLLEMRRAISDLRRDMKSAMNVDKLDSKIVGALGKYEEKLTQMVRSNAGDEAADRLAYLDRRWRAEVGDVRRDLGPVVMSDELVRRDKTGGNFVSSIISDSGKVNENKYISYRNLFMRSGDEAGKEALDNMDEMIAFRLSEKIGMSGSTGGQILKSIHDNWSFFGNPIGKKAFARVGQALGGRLAEAVRASKNKKIASVNSSDFLKHLRDPNDRRKVRELFSNAFGGEENGDNLLKWVFTQHLMNSGNPKRFFHANRDAMKGFYTEDQMTAMRHLSTAYNNANKFKVDDLLEGRSLISGQLSDSAVGKLERFAMERLGNSLGSLLSTLRLWAVRQQGAVYVGAAAVGRIFRARNTRQMVDLLMSEASSNPKVAKAINTGNWKALNGDEMKTFVKRLGIGTMALGGEPNEEQKRAHAIARSRKGQSGHDLNVKRTTEAADAFLRAGGQ